MTSRKFALAFLASLTLLVSIRQSQGAIAVNPFENRSNEEALEERMRREAPKAWDRYRKKLFDLPRESTANVETIGHPTIISHTIRRVGKRGRLTEFAYQGKRTVKASNSRYRFQILKDSGAGWKIETIEVKKNRHADAYRWTDTEGNSNRTDIEHRLLRAFTRPDMMYLRYTGSSLRRLLSDEHRDELTIKKIEEIQENGVNVVRVQFESLYLRPPDSSHDYPNTDLRGEFSLLPDHDWALKSWHFIFFDLDEQKPYDVSYEFHVQYRNLASDPIALPIRTEFKEHSLEQGLFQHSVVNYVPESWDRPKCSDSELTLSAYGLPEPANVPRPRGGSPWRLWVFIAGVVLLAGGVFLYRKFR